MKNQFKKVLSVVLVAVMCLSSLVVGVSAANECAHANATKIGTAVEATCEGWGYQLYECDDCGEEFASDWVKPLGHNIPEGSTEFVPATCEDDAYEVGTCSVCNKEVKVVDEGTALGHKAGTTQYTKYPNCEAGEGGYTYYLCVHCGEEMNVDNEVAGTHTWVAIEETLVAPTCTTKGSMQYKCKECDKTTTVEIEKVAHDWDTKAAAAHTSDTSKGHKTYRVCKDCDLLQVIKEGSTTEWVDATAIPVIEHTYNWTLGGERAEDCVNNVLAIDKGVCTLCGHETTRNAEALRHTFTYDEDGELVAEIVTAPTCTKWGMTAAVCEDCGTMVDAEPVKPLGHSVHGASIDLTGKTGIYKADGTLDATKAGTPVDATCDKAAYTPYACDICGTNVEIYDATKPATGHKWVENTPYQAPTCVGASADGTTKGAVGYYKTEKCEKCNAYRGFKTNDDGEFVDVNGAVTTDPAEYVRVEIPGLTHTKVTTTYPASCTKDGYTVDECSVCKEELSARTVSTTDKADGVSHVMKEEVIQPATCTSAGSKKIFCADCSEKDSVEPIPATGHDWKDEADETIPGTCKDKSYQIFSCANEGCTAVNTVYGSYDYTEEGHEREMEQNGQTGTFVKGLRAPQCTVEGADVYNCAACGQNYDKNTGYLAGHTKVEMPAKAPDCTIEENGYMADGIWCNGCNDWSVEPTEVPYTHTWSEEQEAQAETCTVDGWKAYKYCTVCEAKEGTKGLKAKDTVKTSDGVKIPAHNTPANEKKKVDAQAPTCSADGWIEFTYCEKCENPATIKTSAGIKVAKLTVANGGIVKVPGLSVTATCTQFGYDTFVCPCCDKVVLGNYVEVLPHDYDEDNDGTDEIYTQVVDCTNDGYKYKECVDCGHKLIDEETRTPAKKHKNAAGELFTGACTETITDKACVQCGKTVEVVHTTGTKYFEETCTDYAYTLEYCSDCNLQKVTVHDDETDTEKYGAPLGHTPGTIITAECKAPTYTEEGVLVYYCATCDVKITETLEVLDDIVIEIEADNAVNSGANIVNGGLVKFTVTIKANDFAANSAKVEFAYIADQMEFVSVEVADIFGEGTESYHYDAEVEAATATTPAVNMLTVYAYASNTADNKVQDVELAGELVFATITFRLTADADDVLNGLDVGTSAGPVTLGNQGLAMAAVEFANTDEDVESAYSDACIFDISTIGYVNNDAFMNSVDALVIRQIISGEYIVDNEAVTYLAEADFDMDGEITLADFAAYSKYLVGEYDYEELATLSHPVEEEESTTTPAA